MSPVARRVIIAAVAVSALGGGIYFLIPSTGVQPVTAVTHPAPEPPQNRKSAELVWARGIAALEADHPTRAIKLLDRAIAADGSFAEAYVARGNARIATGEFDAAITDFDQALAIDPEQTDAMSGKGMIFWLRGDLADAEQQFAAVTGLRPDDRAAAVRYAIILVDEGKKREVRDFYEDAYRKNPNRGWVIAGLLYAVRARQADEASGREASQARAMTMWYDGVRLPEVSQEIGLDDLYFRRFDSAIARLQPLLAEDPNEIDTDVIRQLALAYRESGKSNECRATWNDYLSRMGRASSAMADHDSGNEGTGFPDATAACGPQPAAPSM